MKNLYIETLNKTVDQGGEGSVVYFTKLENDQETVLQLAKLKTFEYRFLRKLREKIKGLSKNDFKTIDEILYNIKIESEEILRNEGHSINLYNLLNFANFVLNFIFTIGKNLSYEDQFATFINNLKVIFNLFNIENNLNIDNFFSDLILNENYIKCIAKITYLTLSLKKDSIINFNKELDSVNFFFESFIKKEISTKKLQSYEKLNNFCIKNKFTKGNIYILTNSGLIASGKSTMLKSLENLLKDNFTKDEANIGLISSDFLRAKLQDEIRNSCKLYENQFSLDNYLKQKLGEEFTKQLISYINCSYDENKLNIVIADKNFFLDTLHKLKKYTLN